MRRQSKAEEALHRQILMIEEKMQKERDVVRDVEQRLKILGEMHDQLSEEKQRLMSQRINASARERMKR